MDVQLQHLIPEAILLAMACIVTLLGLSPKDSMRKLTQLLAALALLASLILSIGHLVTLSPCHLVTPSPFFNPDYITLLACGIGLLTVFAAWDMPSKSDPSVADSHYRGEFFGMMLFSLAGVAMIGKVNDLVWLFIALELVSIPTYILVATGRSQAVAQEAGVKYFFLGALAAAIFVFGFSYLYGATGSTRFVDIAVWFKANSTMTPLAMIGLIMAIVGVSYKIAAVPLHFYTPDVYQGAATPVTALLAFAPKTAGFVAIISLLSLFHFNFSGPSGSSILSLLTVMSVVTMSVGNVLALLQRNIKRILAYSSIAHSGYMLVGLVAGPNAGVDATLFYLASYAIMNLGVFAVLIYLQGKADTAEDLDDLSGVAREHPLAALLMAVCLFSLIGMPLTVGFLGKLYLLVAALSTGHTILAVILVINAAVAAAYYLRIIAAMYLREPLYPFATRSSVPIKAAAIICSLAVVVFFFVPGPLSQANARSLDTTTMTPPPMRTILPAPTQPASSLE
ncbi:MAG: NADH-quinone oxidoreductase subunit N [Phycisphaerales bacterium]|nr:NADH-quinone oxidoreductase subunit N [Phycisphaerales bacterium]